MSKLTAKLSDGREYEVRSSYETVDGTEMRLFCKPIKPEPPEEIFIRAYSDGSISASYRTMTEAIAYTRGYSGPSNIHRYILASEPEPAKKPREWWVVQWQGPFDQMVQCERQFESQADAACWAARILLAKPFEIVRVREVEG